MNVHLHEKTVATRAHCESLLPPTAQVPYCDSDWSLGFQPGLLRALFGKMKDFRQGLPTFVPSIWDNVHGLEKTRVVGMISFMWQGGQLFVWC